MSDSVSEAHVQQYSANITHLAQQRMSNLRGACMQETVIGKRFAIERLGATTMQERTSRHDDSPMIPVPHSRRWLSTRFFETGDMIDTFDKVRMLIDPASDYVQAFARAAGRTIDDQIIGAFFATAVTGEDAAGTASFDSDFSIAHNSEGLTITKLRTARRMLEAAENLEDEGPNRWYIALNALQREQLLATTEVTSSDYNTVKALVNGQVNQFLGFTFLKSERLDVASSIRAVPAWVRSSMVCGFAKEPSGEVAKRADKSFNWYGYYSADIGAVRKDETGVVRIYCDES